MLRPLLIAIQFLTRLPMRLRQPPQGAEVARSLPYYPLVGLLIGLFLAGWAWLIAALPASVQAVLVLTAWILITGALHLDGLADSADAWLGGHGDRERTLAIMKDPYSGPAAVVVLILILLGKFTALQALLEAGAWPQLLLAPLLGRTVLPLLFLTTAYVREGGLGSALSQQLSRPACLASVLIGTAAALALHGLWAVLAVTAVFLLLRALMVKRLGGTTGDTAGALVEITEAAVLIALLL